MVGAPTPTATSATSATNVASLDETSDDRVAPPVRSPRSPESVVDDGEVLAGLVRHATMIVVRFVVRVGQIAERAKQDLEPTEFLGEEGIAAGGSDQIV